MKLRSVGAVGGGFLATALVVVVGLLLIGDRLSGPGGTLTGGYLVANLVLSGTAAVVGGWLAARIAGRRPERHGSALAALIVALSLPGLAAPQPGQPWWYPAAVMAVGAAGAMAGSRVPRLSRAKLSPRSA